MDNNQTYDLNFTTILRPARPDRHPASVSAGSATSTTKSTSLYNRFLLFFLIRTSIVTIHIFHGKKEYSVEYMDGQVVNSTEYSCFPWEKRVVTIWNTCPVTILPLSGMARPFGAALVGQ